MEITPPQAVWAESTVRVSPQVRLFVAQAGGQAPDALLVVHGGPDWDHSYLRKPLGELSDTHRLLLPDLRGCGRSTVGLSADAYTPEAAAGDLVALLDALEVDRCAVLGFSYGGLLAQRLAVAVPQRIRALIIASSSIVTRDPEALAVLGGAEATPTEQRIWADAALSGAQRTRAAAVAAAESDVVAARARDEYLARLADIRFTAEWQQPWRDGTLGPAGLSDAIGRVAQTGIPVLLLHGRHDRRFPVTHARYAAERLPRARAVVLDDAAHMAHIDQPGAWIGAVRSFLLRPPPPARPG
jgi:pimeloyl-ACP methyl ester carboxylesterase